MHYFLRVHYFFVCIGFYFWLFFARALFFVSNGFYFLLNAVPLSETGTGFDNQFENHVI